MKERGAIHSEARKRKMGDPEPRLLTENHPVYTGQMIPEIYDHIQRVRRIENGRGR